MKDAIRAALYPGVAEVNWGPINTLAGRLLSSRLRPEEVAPLITYMRGLYKFRDGSNPILPRLVADYVDAWRATTSASTSTAPAPQQAVANQLTSKYGDKY